MKPIPTQTFPYFLKGGGEAGALMRTIDWADTPLGPPGTWPSPLRHAVRFVLDATVPMYVAWGADHILLYNDAYIPTLGKRHPHAMGVPIRQSSPTVWPLLEPLYAAVMHGEPVGRTNFRILLDKTGQPEECYFDLTYVPLYYNDGTVGGLQAVFIETTEKVRAIQDLEESKEQLQFAMDAAELATWDFDPATNTFTADARYTEWFGLPASEATDNTLALNVIAPEDRARVAAAYTNALNPNSGSYDIEYTIRPKGLPERVLRAKGKTWFNEAKKAYRFNGTLQDVTKESYARKKIEASEAYFRKLTDTVPAIIWITEPDGSCTYLNKNWYDYTGQSAAEAEGFGWLSVIHPDDLERSRAVFLEANAKRVPFSTLCRFRNKAGEYRWNIDSGSPKFGTDGSYEGMIGSVLEVHDQKVAEEGLRASEDRYQNFVRRSSEGIWRFEVEHPIPVHLSAAEQIERFFEEGYLAECNDAMAQMYGFQNAAELVGMRLTDFFPRDADTEAYFSHFINSGYRVQDAESKELTKGGAIRYFSNNLIGIVENGLLHRAWGTQRDVTAQRAAEEKIRESEAKLKSIIAAAPAAIGLFVGRDLVIEMPNQTFIDIVGKGDTITGKPLREAMPELITEGQPFLRILDDVYTSGEMFQTHGSQVKIVQNGVMTQHYYNFTYTPLFDTEGKVYAILDIAVDVTEQVFARKRIEESEQRFQNLIQEATVGIIVLRGEGLEVELVNEAYGKLISRTPADLLGKPLFSIIPEAEAHYSPYLKSVLHTGEPVYLYDSPYTVAADGQQRIEGFLNVVYQPYRGADGTVTGVMALCSDVTEQVRARKRLEASEQQVRSLVESAPFPIGVYTGQEMRIQLANQSMIETWGKGPDIVGKNYADVLPELDPAIYKQLDDVYTTGIPFHATNQRVDLLMAGTLQSFYFNYSFTPLFDAAGAVYGVMNTGVDVTDLNLAKQKVEGSERNLRNIILQAPVAMCLLKGPQHLIEIANERIIELWGKPGAAVLHKPMFEAVPEAGGQGFELLLQTVFETGTPFQDMEKEVMLLRQGRMETVYVNFAFEPLYESKGIISGIMAVALDVTDQVVARRKIEEVVAARTAELARANENLLKSNQELSRSNTNLEEFAYAASHDLKEPIRKIHFFGDRLRHTLGSRLGEEEHRLFERMEVAAKRMSSLIDDLLTYSQISLRPHSFEPVDLNQLIDLVLGDLDLEIEEKGASITVDKLFSIRGHHRQLQQAFQNLIGNALKYSRPGVTPHIHISCNTVLGRDSGLHLSPDEQDRTYYLVRVADNGIGFEQKDAERIFNVFTRLHGNAEFRGTGIGLSIVRKVLENHQGYIAAESSPGRGSVFRVYLPAR